jgi:phosphate starvation-inducible protein PhoH
MSPVAGQRLTKKQRRVLRQEGVLSNQQPVGFKNNFQLSRIEPLTENQRRTFEAFELGKNLMLHGIAGTGKTFLSIYLSLTEIVSGDGQYNKIFIVRSAVPTRDMGFMPGNQKEKTKVYEAPYYSICTELFGRGDAYEVLKTKDMIEFITTSFVRGITLNNCIIIVDEVQNMSYHEIDSIITRVGDNCRVIFSGDFRQTDFTREHEKSGLKDFLKIIKSMKAFEFIEFEIEDIVRSKMVKEYIIAKDRYERDKNSGSSVRSQLLTES